MTLQISLTFEFIVQVQLHTLRTIMTTSDLFAAISNGQPELVLTALKLHDVYVNGTKLINRVLYTPLMLAAELGKADIVRILLARPETQVN
ncbi:hypothetical protein DYB28_010666, partial [Aphanomyces astaci]